MQLYANEEVNKNGCLGSLLKKKMKFLMEILVGENFFFTLLEYLGRMIFF